MSYGHEDHCPHPGYPCSCKYSTPHTTRLNKDPESWARVNPKAVLAGSPAQAENVLTMALFDIQKLGLEVQRLQKMQRK